MKLKNGKLFVIVLVFICLSAALVAREIKPQPIEGEKTSDEPGADFAYEVAQTTNAVTLARRISGWNGGGTGRLSAAVSGDTVTVTGNVTDATATLRLNIPAGVTVVWQAALTGSPIGNPGRVSGLINVIGDGTFEVASGKIEKTGNDGYSAAILSGEGNNKDNGAVIVSGGIVRSTSGRGIRAWGAGRTVTISGGTVSCTYGTAISYNSTLTISGGTVESTNGSAIVAFGRLTISGGKVSGASGNSAAHRTVISAADARDARPVQITISGGTVESKVNEGIAIHVNRGTVEVSGGTVEARGDGATAIHAGHGVTVSGGTVSATDGMAISTGVNSTVSIKGGLVFAYGSEIATNYTNLISPDMDAVIYIYEGRGVEQGKLNKTTGNGVVVAWDTVKGTRAYTAGTTTDLTVDPAGAAEWGIDGNNGGIRYGANSFFIIPGITVNTP